MTKTGKVPALNKQIQALLWKSTPRMQPRSISVQAEFSAAQQAYLQSFFESFQAGLRTPALSLSVPRKLRSPPGSGIG